ncbi:MAG: hypothetical protein JKX72_03610 [Robiginitomaculum sp.]|nr:hypothetical protein [Robiginitomaculum sp.]
MTKAKTTKTVKTTFKTTDTLRKGLRAYVGMYGAAYERALPVYQKAVKSYDDYAVRGEKLETAASVYAKDATKTVREFATTRYTKRSAQLRAILPATANDRIVALETNIVNLSKKITTFSKNPVTKVTKKTAKAA